MEDLRRQIDDRLAKGQDLIDRQVQDEAELKACRHDYYSWTEYNETLLRRAFDQADPAKAYAGSGFAVFGGNPEPLSVRWQDLQSDISTKMRRLRSLSDQLELFATAPGVATSVPKQAERGADIFIVHGHDSATKTEVARFLAKLTGREPVIFHEQPDRGQTIIEKLEGHAATAGCAVVLLTADDTGAAVGKDHQPRARQNVVFELGYFIGKLGRDRVVVIHEPTVELPSDMSGVLYIALDPNKAWRNKVARELRAAGITVNTDVLLQV